MEGPGSELDTVNKTYLIIAQLSACLYVIINCIKPYVLLNPYNLIQKNKHIDIHQYSPNRNFV